MTTSRIARRTRTRDRARTVARRSAEPTHGRPAEPAVVAGLSNRAMAGFVQAKLAVSRPGDPAERDADRVAAEVMRSAELSRPPMRVAGSCSRCADDGRPCSGCQARRSAEGGTGGRPVEGDPGGGTASVVIPVGGQPLRAVDRAFFEPRLGVDLAGVRVHTGTAAGAAARSLRAKAYTVGHDVVFGTGRYAPETVQGRLLLAHELAHVAQQGGTVRGTVGGTVRRAPEQGLSLFDAGQALLTGGPAALAGELWLRLSPEQKTSYVDRALEGAAMVVAKLPSDPMLGVLWPLFRTGLEGFIARLRSPRVKAEEKVRAMDKIAGIVAGRNPEFNKAFLTGVAKGFFVEGMLGIFVMIRDVVLAMPRIWAFVENVGRTIGGFPDAVADLLRELRGTWETLVSESGSIAAQAWEHAKHPGRVLEELSSAWSKVKDLVRSKAGDLAEELVQAVNRPGSEVTLGETTGSVLGQGLWEVLFDVLTAGGGAAVTGVKAALKPVIAFFQRLGGKIASGFMALFRQVHGLLEPAVKWIRSTAGAAKGKLGEFGERLGALVEKLKDFFARLLGGCHESKLTCALPGSRRNKYPEFEPVHPGLRPKALAQAKNLSKQLGIAIPADRLLDAPWIGRLRNKAGKTRPISTSMGFLRSESRFWRKFEELFSEDFKLIGKGRRVTKELAAKYGWDPKYVGDKLVHHHVENGQLVAAIPEGLHHELSGTIHATATVVGRP
ncbi:eCIS core domain-containing protein [Nonomuraea jiangxiensis]|uniref:DUF4157 domain-containing protein n=1 Tax=Nonomuraea jiangxiensis TaxID=633440 RepID=A0A1G9EWG2_9ACTN|nr:DUF4157 domain-containing protein [Nonomuraea jiangxiensis]SDK80413.1 protein of unknown function [Nonomuraea jiangxiensis]